MPVVFAYETRSARHVDAFLESGKRAGARITLLSTPPETSNLEYSLFLRNYVHRSVNPPAFEIACFARYFAIADYLKRSPEDSFFLSDTDVLIQPGYTEIGDFVGDVDALLSAPTTATRDPLKYLEMSPHFSFWRKSSLESFLDYVVQTYSTSSGRALIEATHEQNRQISPRSGVSDMTLLAMWARQSGLNVGNGATVKAGRTIDHNVGMSSHEIADHFQMRWGAKRLIRDESRLLFRTRDAQLIYPYAIHFQGKFKMIMEDTLNRRTFAPIVTAQAISLLRTGRATLIQARKWQASGYRSTRQ